MVRLLGYREDDWRFGGGWNLLCLFSFGKLNSVLDFGYIAL